MVHRERKKIKREDFSLRILASRCFWSKAVLLQVDFKLKEIQVSELIRCPSLCVKPEIFCSEECRRQSCKTEEGEIVGMQECWVTSYLESELGKLLQADSLDTAAPILVSCVCTELKQNSFQAIVFALGTCLPICSPAVHHCLRSRINVPTPACQQSNSLKLL